MSIQKGKFKKENHNIRPEVMVFNETAYQVVRQHHNQAVLDQVENSIKEKVCEAVAA